MQLILSIKKEARRMDRYTQFAISATRLAFEDAGMDLSKEDKERIGVFIGSGIRGIETLHDQYNTIFQKGPKSCKSILRTYDD